MTSISSASKRKTYQQGVLPPRRRMSDLRTDAATEVIKDWRSGVEALV